MNTLTPLQALCLSVAAAMATIALKWSAWWETGSIGILSDALDSIVNLAAASFALAMVWYARRPANADYPYGYSKAEYFSSAFEGALILAAAAGIALVATERVLDPQPLQALGLGTGLALAAAILNFAVARMLMRSGSEHHSLATKADGHHLMADVWMTVGVVAGVLAAGLTGWHWLDPAVGVVVAINLLRQGWQLLTRSFSGLMDGALPEEDLRRLHEVLRPLEAAGGEFKRLRTRRSGARRYAFVELRLPAGWSVERADRLAREAEFAASGLGVTLMVRMMPAATRDRNGPANAGSPPT